jgi:hypothetical protein
MQHLKPQQYFLMLSSQVDASTMLILTRKLKSMMMVSSNGVMFVESFVKNS